MTIIRSAMVTHLPRLNLISTVRGMIVPYRLLIEHRLFCRDLARDNALQGGYTKQEGYDENQEPFGDGTHDGYNS